MTTRNKYPGVDPLVIQQVRYYAWQMKQHPALAEELAEDLEQFLFCELIAPLRQYDCKRSKLNTYVSKILKNRCRNFIRKHGRDKRKCMIGTFRLNNLDNTYYEEGKTAHKDLACTVDISIDDELLRLDMDRLINAMPDPVRKLCQQCTELNVSELSQMQCKTRQSIYRTLKKLRPQFRRVSPCH